MQEKKDNIIELRHITRRFEDGFEAVSDVLGPFRLRQDDDAPHDRGLRSSDGRPDPS